MTARRTQAILSSPGDWGVYANAGEHQRYMERVEDLRSRCAYCPKPEVGMKPRATHLGMCNGLALMSGCEWHVRKWVKEARR
jgi:hypothetical protein